MNNRSLRILVIDDDRGIRKQLCEMVKQSISEVVEASDSAKGLAMAREFRADIVITAWRMPVIDGIAMARSIRGASQNYRPYIILLTATDDESRIFEAFDAGIDDFISKPLNFKTVTARLRAAERIVCLQRENERHREELLRFSADLTRSNLRLREVSTTDELTGLPNRRYALERLRQEWDHSVQHQSALSCLVVEVDGLKQINDLHGHERGDVLLKTLAAILRKVVGLSDVVCRIGGDEFLVICPNGDLLTTMACGQLLMSTVRSFGIRTEGCRFALSIGAAERRPDVPSLEALLNLADRGCIEASRHGQNQVCSLQQGLATQPATPMTVTC